RSLGQSLRRLRSERVALLQLHNHLGGGVGGRVALQPKQVLARGGVADTLDRFKQQGLVGAIGLTAAGDTRACLEVNDSGGFDTAQVYYNVINPSAAWQPLPPKWRGGQDFCGILANEVRCAAAARDALGDAYGTPAQAALRFVLGEPGFATR